MLWRLILESGKSDSSFYSLWIYADTAVIITTFKHINIPTVSISSKFYALRETKTREREMHTLKY